MYHARNILIPLTLRHALIKHRAYNPLSFREFSATPRAQASVEDEDAFLSKFKDTSIYKKLADRPEALNAIKDFAGVLEKQGIAITGMPTMVQMMRLASNSEFRAAIQRVTTEMKNAGVDLKSEEAMQEIMSIQKGNSGRDNS
ncbi:hypothetical protein PILCRDRAFT_811518 [Piloderma croceum F 1598]|uniref:Uncharacterized protein n=1 Tax=Piloderma croceum (strain F 1598) TaxID=765440 RepID=A0A0C3GH74_PILCF|nr:hypothetical protein PILCRDRAFT_811518 [Piloderma croceum F 1598]